MNYYQQTDSVVNINPFQQNIDIIKNFFKKPIVLVNTLFEIMIIPVTLFLFFSIANYLKYSFYAMGNFMSLYDDYYNPQIGNSLVNFILFIGIIACIPSVLTVIAKFIIYFKSKNPNPNANPSSGFTILWILSIISVSLMGLLCFFFIIAMIMAIFSSATLNQLSYYSSYDYSYPGTTATIAFVILLIIYSIIFAIALFYLINQLRFYQSVRKSLNSIYLKRNGAMIFGVFRIISGSFNCISFLIYLLGLIGVASVSASLSDAQSVPIYILALITVLLGLGAGSSLTGGIIAVKYAGYIKSIVTGTNQQFNANFPYSNPVPFSNNAYAQTQPIQNNPFDNIQNQNPYANPQQINPQEPQAPVSDNQYYEPVGNPDPQEDSPQAEDTSQTEETFKTENNTNNNVCPNCGSPVFISDMFCNNCGTKLK
ncbi:MAG: hypothetical protein J1E56_07120 [Ruminococcus sp.]|nr:hypothetical protein [Ruminococcus sp.]